MDTCSTKELLHSLFLLKSMLGSAFGKNPSAGGLSMPEYALMRLVSEDSGAADLASVREYLAVTKAAVSQMLASLEKRGLLVRETDPANRRGLIVTLTAEGEKSLQLKEERVNLRLEELLTALGEPEARRFVALVNKMNTILSTRRSDR